MNHIGEAVQKHLRLTDTVLDLGCGVMQATLDTCPTYKPNRLNCRFILGVDADAQYLDIIKDKPGIGVMFGKLPAITNIFADHSFDVVLLLDVLEHLKPDAAKTLLIAAERIARRKVILYTPGPDRWFDNKENAEKPPFPYLSTDPNPYQEHQWMVDTTWLIERGYIISHDVNPLNDTFAHKTITPPLNFAALEFERANREAVPPLPPLPIRVINRAIRLFNV